MKPNRPAKALPIDSNTSPVGSRAIGLPAVADACSGWRGKNRRASTLCPKGHKQGYMSKVADYEVSSGNVFRDLGLPDADELDIKANLAIKIGQIIARRGLSQAKAAAVLGVDQPKVSAIVRGWLEKFSIERLCEFLTRLGCDVNIRVQERPKLARGRMRIQIAG
jgi:predicted XRE-type DNA-binding protein